jgi:glycosyltransferase involved in cell wall biosynthesis
MRVCHLTSVHHRNDTRIFIKEIPALVEAGHEVLAVVADGLGEEQRNGFKILDAGPSSGRVHRILRQKNKVRNKALDIDAELYHFHDPELIPVGLYLSKKGKKVIYDIHEDMPMSIRSKHWIPPLFRILIANIFTGYENRAARRFAALVTATPYINQRFIKLNPNSVNINNYPIVNELDQQANWTSKERAVCYIGEITRIRGAVEMVQGMEMVDARLYLAGTYESIALRTALSRLPAWSGVEDMGYIDRKTYADVLARSMAGLVVFHPEGNHIHAQPNKIFEYMSAGLPVVGSNFPLWKAIIEKDQCGICVDPLKPGELALAISRLVNDPAMAEKMGDKGREMVREKYNWDREKKKLIELYQTLEGEPDGK